MSIVLLIVGFVLLIKGADYFVDGSSGLAKIFKIPSVVVGLTIVAMGTSLPELVTSVVAAKKGESGLAALTGLLTAFLRQGGFAVHFNILDPETLRRAQREPEKYRNLQVRLCGWNVYFTDLTQREQDEFIQQASAN